MGLSTLSTFLETLSGPESLIDVVGVRRLVVIVVDAGQEQTGAWTNTAAGSSGIDLAVASIDTGMSSSAQANFDLFGQLLRQWKRAAVAARCRMVHSGNSKFSNPRPGWRCTDLDVTLVRLSFDNLGAERARELSTIPTRFSLPADQVSALIQAGRDVVRMTPWAVREQTALQ